MKRKVKIISVAVFLITLALVFIGRPWAGPLYGQAAERQVYVAFGFHVNLKHSYRVDRNDEGGFGKDIRIIRHIIDTLDRANERGLPVKGIWDLDNLFSLEEYLPRYAPDIIEDIRRRVETRGDEIILMSYNNALASALNQKELEVSVTRAVTNAQGSGVADLFGKYSPIVRPQEMMVGPGCYGALRDLGIKAVVLYHSAITFDAFRVFAAPLTRAEAFNPLQYQNKETGEEMVVIPAYNIGDLLENGNLSRLAASLHQEQLQGEINRDVLIFVNFDADDEFWAGYGLPWHLAWLPNAGGLEGLIDDAAELDFVRFTTLDAYLEKHPPLGRVEFGQDLADGNFNGYNNWAEKALTPEIWTVVENDRRVTRLAEQTRRLPGPAAPPEELDAALQASFRRRLELLSTTNFGMAVPGVAPARRREVEQTAAEMRALDDKALDIITTRVRGLLQTEEIPTDVGGRRFLDSFYLFGDGVPVRDAGFFLTFDLSGRLVRSDEDIFISAPGGRIIRPVRTGQTTGPLGQMETVRLYVPAGSVSSAGPFQLWAGKMDALTTSAGPAAAGPRFMQNEFIRVALDDRGLVEGVYFKGRRVLEPGGLSPLITYRSGMDVLDYRPDHMKAEVIQDGSQGAAVLCLSAPLRLPGVPPERQGRVDYFLTLIPGVPHLFLEVDVDYPQTVPDKLLAGGHPALYGYVDPNWLQVAPAEIKPALTADRDRPFRVHKENYLGATSSYDIDYFKHSPRNLNLADVNNHITAGYVAVTATGGGVAVAMETTRLANFAFCPLKVEHHPEEDFFSLRLNPFGSYFGPQYAQPTWGAGLGYKTALTAGGQYQSSAPGYNAVGQSFSLMLSFFDGDHVPDGLRQAQNAFAHPPQAVTNGRVETGYWARRTPKRVTAPLKICAASDEKEVFFHWSQAAGSVESYQLFCGPAPGEYDRVWSTGSLSLETDELEKGRRYFAAVAAVDGQGRIGPRSEEIYFVAGRPPVPQPLTLPLFLQIRLMTAGLFNLVR